MFPVRPDRLYRVVRQRCWRGRQLPPDYQPAPYVLNDRRCWMHQVLPYLEEGPVYERFDTFMLSYWTALGFPEMTVVVPSLCCPSDPVSPKLQTFWGGLNDLPTQGFSGNLWRARAMAIFTARQPRITATRPN